MGNFTPFLGVLEQPTISGLANGLLSSILVDVMLYSNIVGGSIVCIMLVVHTPVGGNGEEEVVIEGIRLEPFSLQLRFSWLMYSMEDGNYVDDTLTD